MTSDSPIKYENDNYRVEVQSGRYAQVIKEGAEYEMCYIVVKRGHGVVELKTTSYVEALSYATASDMALKNRSWDWQERLSDSLPGETPPGGETMQ